MLPQGVKITHPDKLYIGGEWVLPHSGRQLEMVSPNTEQIVARCAEADEADMDRAVAAARDAFDHGTWPSMAPAERVAAFRRMVAHLEARVPELALAWTAQMGGLSSFAGPMHGGSVMTLGQIANYAEAFQFVEQRPSVGAAVGLVVHEPVGVVAAIAPWNGPFGIMANKAAYALLTGCTVVMKPSPETPLEAYIIAEAAEAAGLPAGVVNLVPSHREAADHLVSNPGIDKVSFTGSTLAGKRIAQVCGERIARYTLELGGKSAAIIADDFPIEGAAKLLTGTL
ncbi:MAG: aldehyde dehydrogenase family protein, partial [Novosphingobium sp.]